MTSPAAFTFLVVDDDDVAAEAVVRGMRKHGMDSPIVIAEDGVAALQILRGHQTWKAVPRTPSIDSIDIRPP